MSGTDAAEAMGIMDPVGGAPASSLQVTVVLHPWETGREERERLVGEALALGTPAAPVVLDYIGATHPAAIAGHLADRLRDCGRRQLVLLPAGTEGETIAALVAGRLDGVSLGRCTALAVADGAVTARRAAFGGRVELMLRSAAPVTCATLRPQGEGKGTAAHTTVTQVALHEPPPYPVEAQAADNGRPRVEGASLVVAGGRGIAGPEGFEWLGRIAAALGAGLGGSLPAVDAGWVPVAHQVGQSGKFVAPRIYFAVAISGTPQHMAGISPATRIVALNKDRDADIFSRCDVAVEGDWHDILPLLALELERSRAPV
ncbi:Electron transfer flavoprotein large subunit [Variovorax sp. PBS-H4]|uniref:electron transfer flavoprotein subunit alpha/FixB family protein n=1 Tax=Variovorax sp. PBS-H4 TaxID=434008 RepID=UPI001318ACF6|nr:electron transfer flavoprotein subunit alpha/FixB family protein [Variovorax sp. PBS-H4]VTU27631.1 Electron transfer flavoprotein large subunit [Variovorax sp. PBS-H4]